MGTSPVNCNLCGSGGFRIRETAEEPYKVLECLGCGLVFVHPLPAPSVLAEHYDAAYYSGWLGADRRRRLRMWKTRLDGLEKFRSGGRLLDVGCADGVFLELAARRGWKTNGTEVSAYAAAYAAQASGAGIFRGELPDAGYGAGSFDVVSMWHVLEHMPDPRRCLEEVRGILEPGGLLVLAVPNLNDLLMQAAYMAARFRRPGLFSPGDRELHLYHFSPKTIKAMVEAAGFSCLRIGPDNGVTDPAKRLINSAASVLWRLSGAEIFNAIEVYAEKKR